jgi:hypothetical protein
MKKITVLMISLAALIFAGCGSDGQDGQDGLDAEIYYSGWDSPKQWAGQTRDWYYDTSAPALTNAALNSDIVIGYVSAKNDVYEYAVRTLPAYIDGVNYDFLCRGNQTIQYLSDAYDYPPTSEILFRYVYIPSNIALKSASFKNLSIDQIKKLSYNEMCNKLGISK